MDGLRSRCAQKQVCSGTGVLRPGRARTPQEAPAALPLSSPGPSPQPRDAWRHLCESLSSPPHLSVAFLSPAFCHHRLPLSPVPCVQPRDAWRVPTVRSTQSAPRVPSTATLSSYPTLLRELLPPPSLPSSTSRAHTQRRPAHIQLTPSNVQLILDILWLTQISISKGGMKLPGLFVAGY